MRISSIPLFCAMVVCTVFPCSVQARTSSLSDRMSGRILLQVQSHGEAWYIDPVSKTRFYLGTASDAFQLLRMKGLGIRHAELERYRTTRFPLRLSGRILLDVDDHGQAYYVIPQSLHIARLGNADETYQVLRQQGLGIINSDLESIRIAPSSLPPRSVPVVPVVISPLPSVNDSIAISPSTTPVAISALEQRTQELINQHRQSSGLAPLAWSDVVAEVARAHSRNMANGRVAFGHDGFDGRFTEIQGRLSLSQMGENVAMNTYTDPVATAVEGWLQSDGHRHNIENEAYNQTGIGIVRGAGDAYFFTQIFVTSSH